MKKNLLLLLAVFFALPLFAQQKGKINIPNLKGYVTLKCDFHMHTVFSDGAVWPTVRIDEAFREGLDAISLSDHIEYQPDVIVASHNYTYTNDWVQSTARERGIILIRGGEISREMPPGHSNAIFLTDVDELVKPDYMDAFRAAKAQNAFIFWNHPGWLDQQPDTTLWWPEHTKLLEEGMMHGIEIVNDNSYFPEGHQWCLEKKLTMLGNSDVHAPRPPYSTETHRTMTLVFARNATAEGIREALNERRTAVYFKDFVIGEEIYLKELFENALEWSMNINNNIVNVTVKNNSDLTFTLKPANHDRRLVYFRNTSIVPYTIAPNGTQTFTVRLLDGVTGGDVNFVVENFLVQPNTGMFYTLKI